MLSVQMAHELILNLHTAHLKMDACVLPQKQCSDMRVSQVNSPKMIQDFEFEQSTWVYKRKEASAPLTTSKISLASTKTHLVGKLCTGKGK